MWLVIETEQPSVMADLVRAIDEVFIRATELMLYSCSD
jgi:hypothetical protein